MVSQIRPKVLAATVAGALTTVLMYILKTTLEVEPPPEVVAAITTLFIFLGGYLQPDNTSEKDKQEAYERGREEALEFTRRRG